MTEAFFKVSKNLPFNLLDIENPPRHEPGSAASLMNEYALAARIRELAQHLYPKSPVHHQLGQYREGRFDFFLEVDLIKALIARNNWKPYAVLVKFFKQYDVTAELKRKLSAKSNTSKLWCLKRDPAADLLRTSETMLVIIRGQLVENFPSVPEKDLYERLSWLRYEVVEDCTHRGCLRLDTLPSKDEICKAGFFRFWRFDGKS